MESDLGATACRFAITTPITAQTFTVTPEFAARAHTFFDTHIAGRDPEQPQEAAQSWPTLDSWHYSCYHFALAMLDKTCPTTKEAIDLVCQLARGYTPVMGNLPLGAHGVLRHAFIGSFGDRYITHNVIGMGEDVPLCLQVVNVDSNLALMPYDLMRETFVYYPGKYELVA